MCLFKNYLTLVWSKKIFIYQCQILMGVQMYKRMSTKSKYTRRVGPNNESHQISYSHMPPQKTRPRNRETHAIPPWIHYFIAITNRFLRSSSSEENLTLNSPVDNKDILFTKFLFYSINLLL